MAEATLFAGVRGSGKTLSAVTKAAGYLKDGRVVATNIDLFIEHLVPPYCSTRWYRLPDMPKSHDLAQLPQGNPDPTNERMNGLLILDEAGTFINSRSWNAKDRQDFINWLLQSRKDGWDLLFLGQHVHLLDKQIREAVIDVQGTMRCMDKIRMPLVSPIWKYFTGKPVHLPKWSFGVLRYGFGQGAPVFDTVWLRGSEFYKAYNTLQKINDELGQQGLSSMLSAYEFKGRNMNKWDLRRQMAAGGLVLGLLLGLPGGYVASMFKPSAKEEVKESIDAAVKVKGTVRDSIGRDIVLLTDGRSLPASSFKADTKGQRYLVGTTWYVVQ